uniref:Uncharacterized protein n=1 Tax=Arundo donax TaxID=35708 RepID=A0A0A9AQ64_ARUDO
MHDGLWMSRFQKHCFMWSFIFFTIRIYLSICTTHCYNGYNHITPFMFCDSSRKTRVHDNFYPIVVKRLRHT